MCTMTQDTLESSLVAITVTGEVDAVYRAGDLEGARSVGARPRQPGHPAVRLHLAA